MRAEKTAQKKEIPVVRTTFVLPEPLDQNVEAYGAVCRLSKNTAVVKLLETALSKEGFQPTNTPKVSVTY